MNVISIKPVRQPTVTIDQLKTGETFIRGYHTLEGIQNGTEKFSIYMRLPRSERSMGDIPKRPLDVIAAKEGRIAVNLRTGSCSTIPPDERLFRAILEVNVSIVV